MIILFFFFFFQAEDGIRDYKVTGVQTCALPISEWDADANITGQPFELPGGKLGFAVGGGFRSEALSIDFDGLTRIGKVPGLNAALPTSGHRDSWAGFVEVHIPITSPDMNVPGFRSLEVTAAGRYEIFYPGGDSAVPKVGLRWQPLDEQITL